MLLQAASTVPQVIMPAQLHDQHSLVMRPRQSRSILLKQFPTMNPPKKKVGWPKGRPRGPRKLLPSQCPNGHANMVNGRVSNGDEVNGIQEEYNSSKKSGGVFSVPTSARQGQSILLIGCDGPQTPGINSRPNRDGGTTSNNSASTRTMTAGPSGNNGSQPPKQRATTNPSPPNIRHATPAVSNVPNSPRTRASIRAEIEERRRAHRAALCQPKEKWEADREKAVERINPNMLSGLTCPLCRGLYREPRTARECMHTFCKTCIVQYMARSPSCPMCPTMFHPTEPEKSFLADYSIIRIMEKVFPHLEHIQNSWEQKFYARRGIPIKGKRPPDRGPAHQPRASTSSSTTAESVPTALPMWERPRTDEEELVWAKWMLPVGRLVIVALERKTINVPQVDHKFYVCDWTETTVETIQQFISMQLYETEAKSTSITLHCRDQPLQDKSATVQELTYTYCRDQPPSDRLVLWLSYDFRFQKGGGRNQNIEVRRSEARSLLARPYARNRRL